ncbi:imidazole glycerol phosphate synthase subunit HisH [Methanoregula sp.]|uniref:imidazole glycerol phosphate synthase subunit HisH n=1 Tax=Methanoregula sp. TaxID=2052170 RepID=UPI002C145EEC|nr:imidazole glycerol phosphate synthase subunit HisH [Methanoregula sp.]HVP96047.1 imidazole glycerol phosphate synthase subunit HisH [Methanoregula sp.]
MGKTIAIIDYGLGNLRSVMRGIEAAGARAVITGSPEEIAAADGIVLPGVGAFHEGMDQLGSLRETVCAATKDVPLLGICLGMQMLMDSSEEHGLHKGLCLIPGNVRRFPSVPGIKVPHMGWNTIRLTKEETPLFAGLPREAYVYFVHSYYADTTHEYTLTSTDYILPFASSIVRGNVYGVQFHPEKSGAFGLALLRNFIGLG